LVTTLAASRPRMPERVTSVMKNQPSPPRFTTACAADASARVSNTHCIA
jgi:hypothetical protein